MKPGLLLTLSLFLYECFCSGSCSPQGSKGIKVRPFGRVSRLVFTGNVLAKLDRGGLRSKPARLARVGYPC
jgi:hypothetical protein